MLVRSLEEIDILENEELDQQADQAESHEKAIPVVQDYESIIRSKKKGILNFAFRQGRIWCEPFYALFKPVKAA